MNVDKDALIRASKYKIDCMSSDQLKDFLGILRPPMQDNVFVPITEYDVDERVRVGLTAGKDGYAFGELTGNILWFVYGYDAQGKLYREYAVVNPHNSGERMHLTADQMRKIT